VPHSSKCYIWRYGVQCRGIDSCPSESYSRQASWRVLCWPRGGLEGGRVGASHLGRCPYAGSRVQLTEGRRAHNGGDGDVLSSRAPTTTGMAFHYSGWRHSGGDGCTGPTVTEETRHTGLTSRRHPVWARGRRRYPFRGFHRSHSRGAVCRPYGSGRHSVTELTPAFPHSSPAVPGMAARGGLAEQRRDMFPKRC
jgi:hypothetical protein